jgi:pimeloyl-ACP methyl ester carboxylesterase
MTPMPLVDAGCVQLSYECGGSGPPLLLIMGMGGTILHWGEPFLRGLRKSFEVIAYDHRGVGDSSSLDGPFTVAQLAQDANRLLDALDLPSAHVLGVSMGGMVAQELALTHPERVRSLTLGCTYCGGRGSLLASQEVVEHLIRAMISGERERLLRAAWEVSVCAPRARDADLWAAWRNVGMKRSVAFEVIGLQMRAISEHDTSRCLAALRSPTLVLHGTEDEMIPSSNAHMVHERLPNGRLQILDGAGHLFFWEQPDRAVELVHEHAMTHA